MNSLTGNLESKLEPALGQQIAASGFVEVAESDGTSKVRDLGRFNVVGWHVVAKTCQTRATKK